MLEKSVAEAMETVEGRALIKALLSFSGIEEGSYAADPYLNAYISGKRAVGAVLLEAIRSTDRGAELEVLMRREARNPPKEKAKDFYDQFITGDEVDNED